MRYIASLVVFASLLGFALGGSFVWVLQGQQEPVAHQESRPGNGHQQQQRQHQGGFWSGHSDPGVTVGTGALVIVAIFQAVLFFVQLRYMRVGMKDAELAANASRDSALATRDSVDLAKITARRQLRAYLVVEKCTAERFSGGSMIATLKIRNCGQTPADRMIVVGSIDALRRPTTIIRPVQIERLPKGRLGPGNMTTEEIRRDAFDEGDAKGLSDGTYWINIGGEVEYTDIFGTSWVLPFEFVIDRKGDVRPSTEPKPEYAKGET